MTAPDSIEVLREKDAEARSLAQREFRLPLILEAGAGTGKTTTLVARIVSWCVGRGWDVEIGVANSTAPAESGFDDHASRVLQGIVAVTFTEAAAAEMATRVGEALAELEQGRTPRGLETSNLPPEPTERADRARALLGNLDRMAVTTIHAFCRRLLASSPLEAGLDPNFTVDAEGKTLAEVVRTTLEERLPLAYGDPGDEDFLALAARGFGPRELESALTLLAESGVEPELLESDPLAAKEILELATRFETAAKQVLELVEPRLEKARSIRTAGKVIAALTEILAVKDECLKIVGDEILGGSESLSVDSFRDRVIELFPDNLVKHIGKWAKGSGDLSETEQSHLGDVFDDLAQASQRLQLLVRHIQSLDPALLQHSRRALLSLLVTVRNEMRRRGSETFSALLQDARSLLTTREEICRGIRRRIRQLLVDEFQDTDLLQCEIIQKLALEGDPSERPGLFLVGDPKQSIFGWRSADLRAYDQFVEQIESVGGQVHQLSVNFRSVPGILDEVERVISPLMKKKRGVQPEFQRLVPSPLTSEQTGFEEGENRTVEYWAIADWNHSSEEIQPIPSAARVSQIESRTLARDLRILHDRHGVPWSRTAVLFRAATDTEPYLSAFRDFEIPYFVERDTNFYRRREILDVSALVRTILDPNDHLALITFLRSGWVGVPDGAWIPLWTRKFPEKMSELSRPVRAKLDELSQILRDAAARIPKEIPGMDRIRGWEENALVAVENLAHLREAFSTLAADEFVERLRRLLLLEATEAARYLGPYRLANLDRFFRQLNESLEECCGDPQPILRLLRAGVGQGREAEEGRPNEAALDAVQVMTIHKAKGLDFDHVYLVQTHRARQPSEKTETLAPEVGGDPTTAREYQLFGAPTPGFDRTLIREAEVETAERIRTLYVALTRAKRRVVFSGLWLKSSSVTSPSRAQNHMDLAFAARRIPEFLISAMGEKKRTHDADGVRWLFPGLDPESHFDFTPTQPDALPRPEEVERNAKHLGKCRKEAQARMGRTFRRSASDEAHRDLASVFADAPGTRPSISSRRIALAVGTAVHRVLELLDLEKDLDPALAEARGFSARILESLLPSAEQREDRERAQCRTDELFDRFQKGPLFPRLDALRPQVLARELPLLMPPAESPEAPVGFTSGTIDLVYRDPGKGAEHLVIVDYKTDRVTSSEDAEARALAYSGQLEVYREAVRGAFGLERPPRCELWFLETGSVVASPGPVRPA